MMLNELSMFPQFPDKYIANQKMVLFAETISTARKQKFKHIRSEYDTNSIKIADNYSLHEQSACH
jgi:hypothetical protein